MKLVEVSVLGAPDLGHGEARSLTALQSRLLGLLICERPAIVHPETLAELLWRGAPPKTYQSALRLHISRLRDAIGPRSVIVNRPGRGYLFDDTKVELDRDRFVQTVNQAKALGPHDQDHRARELFDTALGMWRGTPYTGCDDHHNAITERALLEQVRRDAIEGRLRTLLALDLAAEAIPELRALVAERPDDERAAAMLMNALTNQGYTADALRVFDEVERRLRHEFGVGPSILLEQTAEAIADHRLSCPQSLLPPLIPSREAVA